MLLELFMGCQGLVELYLKPEAFSRGCKQDVMAPSCCDFILSVTFKEVPGHQDLSSVDGEIRVFRYVA